MGMVVDDRIGFFRALIRAKGSCIFLYRRLKPEDMDDMYSRRFVRPVRLVRTKKGDIVLHAHDYDRGEMRSFRIERIDVVLSLGFGEDI